MIYAKKYNCWSQFRNNIIKKIRKSFIGCFHKNWENVMERKKKYRFIERQLNKESN